MELKLSEVLVDNETRRFDSEYFKKEYIDILNYIHTFEHDKLGDFTKVTDGEHGSVDFIDSGIKYLTAENIKKGFVDISNIRYVSKEVDLRNKRASVEIDDILISIKGTLGEVAIAEPWLLPANMNRDVAIIKNRQKEKYFSDYITIFLMSNIGKKLSEREGSGGVQQMITLERLRTILIPKLNNVLQNKISELYKLSRRKLEISKTLYKEAEELLLEELDLLDFRPSEESIVIKSLKESFLTTGRLDSEYYQPKYDEIIEKIKSYKGGYKYLSEIANTFRGNLISDYFYSNEGVPYIRGADISSNILEDGKLTYIDNNFKYTNEKILQVDDLVFALIGTVGSISRVTEKFKDSYLSNNLGFIRLKNHIVKSVILHLVLTSEKIGKLYFEQKEMRTAQPKISDKDIHDFIIPIIAPSIQIQIEAKIKQSFELKEQSKKLLDLAKRVVEVAIEKDENEAIKLIKVRMCQISPD